MTSSIFETHIRKIDRAMLAGNRKVAILVDNCPAHPHIEGLQAVTLIFLPPNTTSQTQPLDCGVIRCLKSHYRKQLMTEVLIAHDAKIDFIPNMMNSLQWLKTAWNNVSAEIITNCFHSAGFQSDLLLPLPSTPIDNSEVNEVFERMCHEFSILNVSLDLYSSIDDDVITTEALNESDIISSMIHTSPAFDIDESGDEDIHESEMTAPTPAEALQMLHKVQLCLLKHSSSEADFCSIDNLQLSLTNMAFNTKKQTTLESFWNV